MTDPAFVDALKLWVQRCRLSSWVPVDLLQHVPGNETCAVRIPLLGMKQALPELDISDHGREFDGVLFHGTSFSNLPSILSAGCLLRCSVPTKGYHAIWAAESIKRAMLYAPPVMLAGRQVQCILALKAGRVKASHFKSTDKQLMLRECWHQVDWLYICQHTGQQLYRSTHQPLGSMLPHFRWDNAFGNWNALPPPWVVSNGDATTSAGITGNIIPDIPMPWTVRATSYTN